MGREPVHACQECGGAPGRCICSDLDRVGIVNGAKARDRNRRRRELRTDGGENDVFDDMKPPEWAEEDPEAWERLREKWTRYGTVDVHNEVDLTPKMWSFVDDKADPLIDVVDFLQHEYLIRVEGEEVYRTSGYEPDRPTLTGEDRGTEVTVEIDVPRDVYEEAVEQTEYMNSLPEEKQFGKNPSTVEGKLIDMIDLDIRYFVEGEEIDVGPAFPEDHGDG